MKRMHRRYVWFLAAVLPVPLFAFIAERNSWRPKTLGVRHGAVAPLIVFSPDGHKLIVAYNDNSQPKIVNNWIEVWTYPALHLERRFSFVKGRSQDLEAIAIEPQENRIATIHTGWLTSPNKDDDDPRQQFLIRFWDINTGRLHKSLISPLDARGPQDSSLWFWPDKNQLNCCTGDFPFSVIPTTGTWKKKKPFWQRGRGSIPSNSAGPLIVFSLDAVTVASSGNNKTPIRDVFLANGQTNEVKRWLPSRSQDTDTWPLAFSPDGTYLIGETGGVKGNTYVYALHVWDVRSGTLLHTLPMQGEGSYSLAFASDEGLLAVSNRTDTIMLWDVAKGTLLRTLASSKQTIHTIAFAPDGNTLVSASLDGSITLWRIK